MICNDIYMVHRLPTLMLQLQTHLHTNLLGGGGSICMWSPVGACLRYCSRKDWNENHRLVGDPCIPVWRITKDHEGSSNRMTTFYKWESVKWMSSQRMRHQAAVHWTRMPWNFGGEIDELSINRFICLLGSQRGIGCVSDACVCVYINYIDVCIY